MSSSERVHSRRPTSVSRARRERPTSRGARPGADRLVEAADRALGGFAVLIAQGQAEGALAAGDPERVGLVLFAAVHGIVALTNGAMVDPALLDGLVEAAVVQFVRGAAPA